MADPHEGPPTGRAKRVPVSTLVQYRFDTREEFATDYSADISTSGVFIATDTPREIGSTVYLAITLRDAAKVIEGFGRVARVGPGSRGQMGMAVQFVGFDAESSALVERLVAAKTS